MSKQDKPKSPGFYTPIGIAPGEHSTSSLHNTDNQKVAALSYLCGHCGFVHNLPEETQFAVLTILTEARLNELERLQAYLGFDQQLAPEALRQKESN